MSVTLRVFPRYAVSIGRRQYREAVHIERFVPARPLVAVMLHANTLQCLIQETISVPKGFRIRWLWKPGLGLIAVTTSVKLLLTGGFCRNS
ncbi:MAG: hypothetical protein H6969_01185 [Gammaproteobacteria bacterium]|nr:hypothetical protein [Gammaproteobacteria bacterium]